MMNPDFSDTTIRMLHFNLFERECNIFHFITTRSGGVSDGAYNSFNLSEYSGDDPACVCVNRARLSELIGIFSEDLHIPLQVHGSEIGLLDHSFMELSPEDRTGYLSGKDALVTALPEVCVAVTTADCVPVLLYAPDKKVVAAVHAGWKGTVSAIVAQTVRFMRDNCGCDPGCLLAGIGPSISQSAFEVGDEVLATFEKEDWFDASMYYRHPESGKAHIDLWEANRQQLLLEGVTKGHLEVSAICTYTHPDTFFSARRLGIDSGRFLTGIYIR